jgi:hypothetical protein
VVQGEEGDPEQQCPKLHGARVATRVGGEKVEGDEVDRDGEAAVVAPQCPGVATTLPPRQVPPMGLHNDT